MSIQLEATGCMTFTTTQSDYPPRTINGKTQGMHRHAYEMTKGPIPAGMVVRHKCDNARCFNPDHLEIGTQADNSRDTGERGRIVVRHDIPRAKPRRHPKWVTA